MNEKRNIIKDKSFAFAIDIVKIYQQLIEKQKEYVLSKQLLRSGTAVGALVREAQNAESKADFIHKLAIAQKECDECLYWIELLIEAKYVTGSEIETIQVKATELLKMIRSAIVTLKSK